MNTHFQSHRLLQAGLFLPWGLALNPLGAARADIEGHQP